MRIQGRDTFPSTKASMMAAVQEEWDKLEPSDFNMYIDEISERIAESLYLLGQLIGGPRRDRLAGTQVDTYRPEVRLGGEGERVLASSASQAMYHVSWMVVNCRVDVSVSVSVLEMHFDGWDGKPFEAPGPRDDTTTNTSKKQTHLAQQIQQPLSERLWLRTAHGYLAAASARKVACALKWDHGVELLISMSMARSSFILDVSGVTTARTADRGCHTGGVEPCMEGD
ncbi:hypothetical protein EX30DRAFT_349291 [Ascodesmis nigricans]|uniref:Uncharacterized protein n=1 Tax=Ascodesmis nigricans TaxID=341454 RepID=A0A4S2MW43_9PEZI|nr:hypothetical protein EX30DRAFT_349291 [Ascodesmis nigricans]